ncbi:hypothetical protein PIB30_005417 [Stylosanthes scabra]|uniref:Replication factor A C-terminal domain-containing protein n=1 Tax=Stylosanthes scabra TaxID=79078 RepID=A0ABU6X4R6_9FABA|nr:hypothetical protein [Stylosanthes scabra]
MVGKQCRRRSSRRFRRHDRIPMRYFSSQSMKEGDGVDRVADIKPTKLEWNLVVGVARIYRMPCHWISKDAYSMELVLQDKHERLKVTAHKYKLVVFLRTNVSILYGDVFPFRPFCFTPFREIDEMCASNNIYLIDCIGQVVGKEAPEDIITKTGQSSKRLRLYLEDVEKNKMKCTLFGEFVGEALCYLEKTDVQPLVLVAQLFKPHVWLDDVNVQTSFYGSRVFFNPTDLEAAEFRNSLINLGEHATQEISHVESHEQRSVTQDLSSGDFPFLSVEQVYNLTEETECWILSTVVSIEGGRNDWFYASCKGCFKKVIPIDDNYHCTNVKCGQRGSKPPLKFRLKVIVTDGIGFLTVLLWNTECAAILGMSPNDVRDVSAVDQSLDIALPSAGTVESSSDGTGEPVVSLAKDTESRIEVIHCDNSPSNTIATGLSSKDVESHIDIESPDDSPPKTVVATLRSKGNVAVTPPAEGQGSNGKIFKRVGVKRKAD